MSAREGQGVSARERILGRVRAAVGRRVVAPARFVPAVRACDFPALSRLLDAAGAEAHGPFERAELGARVAERCRTWANGGRVVATAAACAKLGAGPWTPVDPEADPHALADVAVAIVCAELGVAENGALGLSGREVRPRALAVLCERLIVLIDVARLVPDLHAAFDALPGDALAQHHFTFLAGPSKTADIEGELVLGAHGARELAVFGSSD